MSQENEQKKDFLKSYNKAKMKIWRLEEELEELRQNKISPSIINDGMPHASNVSDLSGYAAKVDEIERNIMRQRYLCVCTFQDVRGHIDAMTEEREKVLLTYRYLRGMKWEDICVKMDYSWKHMHRIHADALKNFSLEQDDIE